jgi:hypothetical protein
MDHRSSHLRRRHAEYTPDVRTRFTASASLMSFPLEAPTHERIHGLPRPTRRALRRESARGGRLVAVHLGALLVPEPARLVGQLLVVAPRHMGDPARHVPRARRAARHCVRFGSPDALGGLGVEFMEAHSQTRAHKLVTAGGVPVACAPSMS